MENLDYTNKDQVINYIKKNIVPQIYEDLSDYDTDPFEAVHEIIDGLSDVIYNYQAEKIAEAFGYCPFESVSEITGEKFNSYNEIAFEIIYNEFMSEYSLSLTFYHSFRS